MAHWSKVPIFFCKKYLKVPINGSIIELSIKRNYNLKVIGRELITTYIANNCDAQKPLQCWLREVEEASWKDKEIIKTSYRGIDFLPNNKVIFHFFAGSFKLLALIVIGAGVIIVEKIGSIAESSKWNLK